MSSEDLSLLNSNIDKVAEALAERALAVRESQGMRKEAGIGDMFSRAGQFVKDNPLPFVGTGVGGAIGGLSSLGNKKRKNTLSSIATGALAGGGLGFGAQLLSRSGEVSGLDDTPEVPPVVARQAKLDKTLDAVAKAANPTGARIRAGIGLAAAGDVVNATNPLLSSQLGARRIERMSQSPGGSLSTAIADSQMGRSQLAKVIEETRRAEPGLARSLAKQLGTNKLTSQLRNRLGRTWAQRLGVNRLHELSIPGRASGAPLIGAGNEAVRATRTGLARLAEEGSRFKPGVTGRLAGYGLPLIGSYLLDRALQNQAREIAAKRLQILGKK